MNKKGKRLGNKTGKRKRGDVAAKNLAKRIWKVKDVELIERVKRIFLNLRRRKDPCKKLSLGEKSLRQ